MIEPLFSKLKATNIDPELISFNWFYKDIYQKLEVNLNYLKLKFHTIVSCEIFVFTYLFININKDWLIGLYLFNVYEERNIQKF